MPRPEDRFSIQLLRAVNTLVARVYHDLTILSPSDLPWRGGGILVSNHISPIDPILIQSGCHHRLIEWMMAKEYMELPLMGRVFQQLEVIPVDRGSRETGPLRTALRRLKEGRIIGIFPEGRISPNRDLLDFQTGVALMALRAKTPIFPVYLDGSQRGKTMIKAFTERSTTVMAFGSPLVLQQPDTSVDSLERATAEIRREIQRLRIRVDAYRSAR